MKNLITLVSFILLTMTLHAQVDRSQPKPGAALAINVTSPKQFKMANGMKVLVVENHKLPRVSYSLTLDNKPYLEGDLIGVDDLMASLLGNGTTKTPKAQFVEEIDYLGASIDFHSSGVSARALSKYGDRVLELLAEGVLFPEFDQQELEKEKAKHIEGLKASEKNVKVIADRVQNALVYGKNHPFGEFETVETINGVDLKAVQAHYNQFFVPENAYLVVVGDVAFEEVKQKIESLFGSWAKKSAPNVDYKSTPDVEKTEVNIVDVPHAVQSEIAVLNTLELPMSSPDFFAVLLANQILGGGGEGRLFLNLREKHGWTYGAYSSARASKYVSKFKASTSVRTEVTDSAVVEIVNEIKRMRIEKVSDEDLKNAKAKYIGNFVMGIEKPETIARHALNIESQGLPEDFYKNFIKNIEKVTVDKVQEVAQKYFKLDQLRIVVAGKREEIESGLSNLGYPVKIYDVNADLVK